MEPKPDGAEVPPSKDPRWLLGCGLVLIGCAIFCGLSTVIVGPSWVPFLAERDSFDPIENSCNFYGLLIFLVLILPGSLMILEARERLRSQSR